MKTVFITQRLMESPHFAETRECLDIRWGDFLSKCDIIPIPLPIKSDLRAYFHEFRVGGIIMTGGNDLYCCNPDNSLNAQRDRIEKKLLKEGIARGIPILGVCRGMQMIANFFGLKIEKINSHAGTKHYVEIPQGNILNSFYGNRHKVNSYHRYGLLHAVPPPLTALAISIKDACVESIYHKKFNVVGIMWHPERETPYSQPDISFFRSFFGRGKV